jgi:hypothetical protein
MPLPGSANAAIASAQRILESIQSEAEFYRAMQEGDPRTRLVPLSSFNKQNMVRCQRMTLQWRKIGRKVLAMHPGVVDEVKVASSDKIPTDHLATLPYLNPMVVFADPPVFKSWLADGQAHPLSGKTETHMKLLGFLTAGFGDGIVTDQSDGRVKVEQRIYATNNLDADRFGMMVVLEALDETGKSVGIEFNTLTLRYGVELTFTETVDDVMSRFHWDDDEHPGKKNKRWMREVLSVCIGSLFYLCSTTCEAQEVPPRRQGHKIPKKVLRQPMSFYKIGWTTGPALTRIRHERELVWKESEQGDIRHQQDPQHRRAHFRMQWYGPMDGIVCDNTTGKCECGGRHRVMIFVCAYWTHIERLGQAGMNTAHVVPSLGRGEPRQSLKTVLNMPTDGNTNPRRKGA